MTDHNLSVDQQLVNAGNGDRIILPSIAGLSLSYFGLVTVDSSAQSVQIVPNGIDTINGNQGTITYKISGFYVLIITLDRSLGWMINPLAISIPDLLSALDLSSPFSVSQGGTGLSSIPSANFILGVNGAGTAYEGKNLVEGTNVTITNGAGSITISSSASGGGGSSYQGLSGDPTRGLMIYQNQGLQTSTWVTNFNNTLTQANWAYVAPTGSREYLKSTASPGNDAEVYNANFEDCTILSDPTFFTTIYPTSVSNVRIWAGLAETRLNGYDDPALAPSPNTIAFRFSTVAGDTTFKAVVAGNATGSTSDIDDTGITVAINTKYELFIDASDISAVEFYINGVLVATMDATTHVYPDITLGYYGSVTSTSGAKNCLFGRAIVEWNN